MYYEYEKNIDNANNYIDLPSLEIITLREWAFEHCQQVIIESREYYQYIA